MPSGSSHSCSGRQPASFGLTVITAAARWMILGGNEDIEDTSEEASLASEHARHQRVQEMRKLIGAKGVALTSLRPVGKVKIEDRRIDAMAESGVIESGAPIVVVDVYDNQIKVRAE